MWLLARALPDTPCAGSLASTQEVLNEFRPRQDRDPYICVTNKNQLNNHTKMGNTLRLCENLYVRHRQDHPSFAGPSHTPPPPPSKRKRVFKCNK